MASRRTNETGRRRPRRVWRGRPILFLTGNAHKVAEARSVLNKHNLRIIQKPAKGIEIQSDSVEEVARACAEDAYRRFRVPLMVEDSGLFIERLGGFPGVYSASIHDQIGCAGILRLLAQERQRAARFDCAIAYIDSRGLRIFRGTVKGRIAHRISRGEGFGYDPIFIPSGYSKTFSQIPEAKARLSHRTVALLKLARYLAPPRAESKNR